MNHFHILLVLLSFTIPFHASRADIVSYVDDRGSRHFVESIERVPEQYREQAKQSKPLPPINKLATTGLAPAPLLEPKGASSNKTAPTLEVFVTSWCPYCQALEEYLTSRKIKYRRYDIEKNAEGKKIHKSLGGGGIPVSRINGTKVIRGFNKATFDAALP